MTVRGVDLDGNEVVIEGDELLGRLFQHEIDHLDGVLLLDRLEPDERKEAMRELARPARRVAPRDGRRRRPVAGSDRRAVVRIVYSGRPPTPSPRSRAP